MNILQGDKSRGWIRSVRDSKPLDSCVHDGTHFNSLQVVYHDTMDNLQKYQN